MIQYPLVREFMDRRFVTLRAEMPVYQAIHIFLENRVTGAVVVGSREDELVGVLSEKDCLQGFVQGAYNNEPVGTVADFMSSKITSIDPNLDVMAVAGLFMKHVYRRFPVVEDGRLIGQITRRDLLRAVHQILRDDWSIS